MTEIGTERETGIIARSTSGMIGISIRLRARQSGTPKDVRLASPQHGTAHHLLLACVHGATTVIVCSSNSFHAKPPSRHHGDLPLHVCNAIDADCINSTLTQPPQQPTC